MSRYRHNREFQQYQPQQMQALQAYSPDISGRMAQYATALQAPLCNNSLASHNPNTSEYWTSNNGNTDTARH